MLVWDIVAYFSDASVGYSTMSHRGIGKTGNIDTSNTHIHDLLYYRLGADTSIIKGGGVKLVI
jgi:hypothetical protein